MKTYLFNAETGLYEGETFEEADILQYEEGITPVPPPEYEHGQVPVFDRQKNSWTVIPVNSYRRASVGIFGRSAGKCACVEPGIG